MNANGLILLILISIGLNCSVFAQSETGVFIMRPVVPAGYNEIQKAVFNKFNDRFKIHSGYAVEINTDGIITNIKTILINNGLTTDDPVERAYQFFELQKDLLQITDPRRELILSDLICSENGSGWMHFDQIVGGVKVYLGGCNIYFDSTGTELTQFDIDYGTGILPKIHELNPIPVIDSFEAVRIVQADTVYGKNKQGVSCQGIWIANSYSRLRKFPDSGIHLVWRIKTYCKMFSIDAHSGKIIFVENSCRDTF
jgi:hypothetical protein